MPLARFLALVTLIAKVLIEPKLRSLRETIYAGLKGALERRG